jgi:hypothetical protein
MDTWQVILWSAFLGAVATNAFTRVGWGYQYIGRHLDRWLKKERA